jgi:hypothetical protein
MPQKTSANALIDLASLANGSGHTRIDTLSGRPGALLLENRHQRVSSTARAFKRGARHIASTPGLSSAKGNERGDRDKCGHSSGPRSATRPAGPPIVVAPYQTLGALRPVGRTSQGRHFNLHKAARHA